MMLPACPDADWLLAWGSTSSNAMLCRWARSDVSAAFELYSYPLNKLHVDF